MADIFQENDKFITAGPYEDIFFIKKQTEQVRQCYQYLISEKMTVGIVCIFKIIRSRTIRPQEAKGSLLFRYSLTSSGRKNDYRAW